MAGGYIERLMGSENIERLMHSGYIGLGGCGYRGLMVCEYIGPSVLGFNQSWVVYIYRKTSGQWIHRKTHAEWIFRGTHR